MTNNVSNKNIIICNKCGAKNRIGPHPASLQPRCARCKTKLLLSSEISEKKYRQPVTFFNVICSTSIVFTIVGVCYAMMVMPIIMAKDYSVIIGKEEDKTTSLKEEQNKQFIEVELQLQKELSEIDAEELRHKAFLSYESILNARRSFDRRYALTPREKSQLRMREIAGDSTKSYDQAVIAVAKETSPKGSDVKVSRTLRGTVLHIDFDMASMTSGEQGTRTKHHTKESFKKEVVSLISKVTNDVFQFCKDLDLDTIHVGCRHHVEVSNPNGSNIVENMMLYKISVEKSKAQNLSNNPFLDIYSTTQYLKVEDDNFSEIEITTERL